MASIVTSGYVEVNVSSNVSSFTSQKRFPVSTTIVELKGKLELITGALANSVQLQLLDENEKLICSLDDDASTLDAYKIKDGMTIYVFDTDPSKSKGQFEDVSQVKKYEMSETDYAKRGDSVRAFKERMKLGRFSEQDSEEAKQKELEEEEMAKAITIGSRCEVTVSVGSAKRRGTVMFVGKTHFKEGYWVGVKYDEPVGKNNGSIGDQKYFECAMKYGGFVRPQAVKTGDFPEEDLVISDDEM